MKSTNVEIANICFVILSIGKGNQVTIQVTRVSQNSDGRLIGKIFVVPNEFPYSKVTLDSRGFYGLDYTVIESRIFDEADLETEFNARVDIKSDSTVTLLGVTVSHLMFNALRSRKNHQQHQITKEKGGDSGAGCKEKSINQLEDAFSNAGTLRPVGGTSDGGTGEDMDHVSDDPRTTQRRKVNALRPAKKKDTGVAA